MSKSTTTTILIIAFVHHLIENLEMCAQRKTNVINKSVLKWNPKCCFLKWTSVKGTASWSVWGPLI